MPQDADRLCGHCWPRPGWRLTFEHAVELHRLVAQFQRTLADLNLVPAQWLHLTI